MSSSSDDDWGVAWVVVLLVFFVVSIGRFVARLEGYGVKDSEVICSKGGEAYLPMGFSHIYRIQSKDAVCKKDDSR